MGSGFGASSFPGFGASSMLQKGEAGVNAAREQIRHRVAQSRVGHLCVGMGERWGEKERGGIGHVGSTGRI